MIFDKDDFKAYDADLWNAIAKEEERQQNNIEFDCFGKRGFQGCYGSSRVLS